MHAVVAFYEDGSRICRNEKDLVPARELANDLALKAAKVNLFTIKISPDSWSIIKQEKIK